MPRAYILLLAALLLPLSVASYAATSPAVTTQATAKNGPQQAMNKLVKAALEQSLKTIYQRGKPIYPFALIEHNSGKVDSITYKPQKNADGSTKAKPSAEDWAAVLFLRLRDMVANNSDLKIALLARMDTVKDKNGNEIMGIWTEVDHRQVRPWVVFMPLVKQADGSYKQGKLIYYATDQAIFKHASKTAAKSHK